MLKYYEPQVQIPFGKTNVADKYVNGLVVLAKPFGSSLAANVDSQTTKNGIVWNFSGSNFVNCGITPNDSQATLFAYAIQGSQVSQFICSSRSALGTDGIEILIGDAGTPGLARLRIDTSATAMQASPDASGLDDGKPHAYCGRWESGSRAEFFVDGSYIGATTNTVGGSLNSTQPLYVARRGSIYFVGQVYVVAYWNRCLGTSECIEITKNPGVLFKKRATFISVSDTPFPTLSNARMNSLTSTSGIPAVDYAF